MSVALKPGVRSLAAASRGFLAIARLSCYYMHCRKFDIMDTMLHKLEKYADNLESIVQQRTGEVIEEKQKTDLLLNRMLPPYAFLTARKLYAAP